MSCRVFLRILYTRDFLWFLLTEYMTDVQACSLKEHLGIFIFFVIHRRCTHMLCGLMLGVSCQGLFIFSALGEEKSGTDVRKRLWCWNLVGGAQGHSVDRCVPLLAATVATVIGNDGQPAGKTGEAACWLGLRRQGRGVGVEQPGICLRARKIGRERWREKDIDGESYISVAVLLK